MSDLEIYNLYERTNPGTIDTFQKRTASKMDLQTEYEKVIEDTEWIDLMETTIPYIDNIFRNPNRFIINEEEIVKIELARKVTVESIKHLAKHTNLIQDVDPKTGDVKPSKILNINKEESYDTYENRFIYTLIQHMKFYMMRKKKMIEERLKLFEKNNKRFSYTGNAKLLNENVSITVNLTTKLDDGNKRKKGETPLERIQRLEEKLLMVMGSETYKLIEKKHIALVTSPIKKTNLILKNVNFQYAVKLWNYIQTNIDDNAKHISEKQDYSDNEELKRLADETFLLNYLILNSLDRDNAEETMQKEVKEQVLNQMIDRIVSLNANLTESEVKDLVADRYLVIRNKNIATLGQIQKVFKKQIEKYLEKIGLRLYFYFTNIRRNSKDVKKNNRKPCFKINK